MKQVKYQKILVTHDGSDLASTALPHAAALALAFNADVLMLQVVNSVEQQIAMMSTSSIGIYPIPVGSGVLETVREYKRFAKHQLEEFKTDFEKSGIKNIKILVKEGSDRDEILETAEKENCDLIVMSTHGRTGLKRALLGSVADHIVRHSECPVFLVNPSRTSKK